MSQRTSGPGGTAGPGGAAGLNLRGAVDLSGLGRPPQQQPAPPSGEGADGVVVTVTEENFQQVVEQSTTVPVVVALSSSRAQGAADLTSVLRRLAAQDAGRWLLGEVDADTSPRIAQAFQVETVPAVLAVVGGQPVPLFQGVLPEEQVRQYVDALLDLAQRQGVTGRLDAGAGEEEQEEPEEPPLPPLHQEAFDAIERDDLDAAADAYRRALAEAPADEDARIGLAQVELLRRSRGADLQEARAAAAEDPTDVDAAMLVADLDVLGGHVEDAFARLVQAVRATSGDDRERVRARLVELFEVVGAADPRVTTARRALASALF